MKRFVLGLLAVLVTSVSVAAERTDAPPPDYLDYLACRIATRTPGPLPMTISALADVQLKTTSKRPEERSFQARLHTGQLLSAMVQHVYISLPRDRFNVTLLLDGKPHLRLNHLDLDIFVETTIGGQPYLLHCFPEIEQDTVDEDGSR